MLHLDKLMQQIKTTASESRALKAELRRPKRMVTTEEAYHLARLKEELTLLYVYRAASKGHVHPTAKPEIHRNAKGEVIFTGIDPLQRFYTLAPAMAAFFGLSDHEKAFMELVRTGAVKAPPPPAPRPKSVYTPPPVKVELGAPAHG